MKLNSLLVYGCGTYNTPYFTWKHAITISELILLSTLQYTPHRHNGCSGSAEEWGACVPEEEC